MLTHSLMVILHSYQFFLMLSSFVQSGWEVGELVQNKFLWMLIFFLVYTVPVVLVNLEGQRVMDADDELRANLEMLVWSHRKLDNFVSSSPAVACKCVKDPLTVSIHHKAKKLGCSTIHQKLQHLRNCVEVPDIIVLI
jgi:hypothetical protein